jgi:hypothetical protein
VAPGAREHATLAEAVCRGVRDSPTRQPAMTPLEVVAPVGVGLVVSVKRLLG